MEEKLAY
jgi:hypothetical protein